MTKTNDKTAKGSDKSGELTRRGFLDRIMLTAAGGAALIVAGTTHADAKAAKKTAKYRSSPKNGKKCSGCKHYKGGGKCTLVSGTVSSNGYCNYYSKRSSYGY